MRAVPLLGGVYPGICLTIEEKARKYLSRGSQKSVFLRQDEKLKNMALRCTAEHWEISINPLKTKRRLLFKDPVRTAL